MSRIGAIVTDIEGTTSPIAFVREVLFPYARAALPAFIARQHARPEVSAWLGMVAGECAVDRSDLNALTAILLGWIDADRKHTALKALQGMVWVDGYRQGTFRAPVYADAAQALSDWHARGIPLYVYSSGSVDAQKLFFANTDHGDLLPLFSGHFDTGSGGKREAASYLRIAGEIGMPPAELLFLSDIVEELDAARDSGYATLLVDRLADYPQPRIGESAHGHPRATGFDGVAV